MGFFKKRDDSIPEIPLLREGASLDEVTAAVNALIENQNEIIRQVKEAKGLSGAAFMQSLTDWDD